jgi:hypothetical protein
MQAQKSNKTQRFNSWFATTQTNHGIDQSWYHRQLSVDV